MPEAAEVAAVADQLREVLLNEEVHRLLTPLDPPRFLQQLPDQIEQMVWPLTCRKVWVKGKELLFHFIAADERDWWLVSHMGMAGAWSLIEEDHTYVELQLANGKSVYYLNARPGVAAKFDWYGDTQLFNLHVNRIAKGFLGEPADIITLAEFTQKLRIRKSYLVSCLVDPYKVISGIGNYLCCEGLYAAKLHPDIKTDRLSDQQIADLFQALHDLVHRAYREKGMSIRNYRGLDGTRGNFMASLCVYARTVDHHGNKVEKLAGHNGRNISWCPAVQTNL